MTKADLTRRSFLAATGAGVLATSLIRPGAANAAARVVRASDFGFDPVDSTEALQAALDSDADTVIVDRQASDWVTRPLFIRRDGLTVIFEDGVVVRAKPGAFPGAGDSLLTADARSDLALIGYGATLAMNKPEYTTGEHRMGLKLRSVRNLLVEGLTIRDSGGDGIYLGVAGSVPYCENVTIRNVVCDNNRRNALSVISVDGLTVEGSAFINSSGTAPQAGIDFEPNHDNERLDNIVIRDCECHGNVSLGIVFGLTQLTDAAAPLSVLLDGCRVGEQRGGSPAVTVTFMGDSDPGGSIEFRDCVVENSPGSGSLGVFRKDAYATDLHFNRCVLRNLGNDFIVYQPITIAAYRASGRVPPATEYGGVRWTDSLLTTDQPAPFLSVRDTVNAEPADTLGLANLQGTLTVVGPGTSTDYGSRPHDIGLTITERETMPSTLVQVSVADASLRAGGTTTLTFRRRAADISVPLAIRYAVEGTASPRIDYDGLSGAVVIPAGADTATVELTSRAHPGTRRDASVRIRVLERADYRVRGLGRAQCVILHR